MQQAKAFSQDPAISQGWGSMALTITKVFPKPFFLVNTPLITTGITQAVQHAKESAEQDPNTDCIQNTIDWILQVKNLIMSVLKACYLNRPQHSQTPP